MSVFVAIPVSFATIRLYVDKGRKWNAVEHLLLFALAAEPQQASQLVGATNLPWRLIVEVMSRLMRVGWVEIVNRKDGVAFQITASGKSVVMNDVLPAITRPLSRRSSFSIDKVSGTVFKTKELAARTQTYLNKLKESFDVVELEPEPSIDRFIPDEVIAALLEEDEHCRGFEPLGSRFLDLYLIVTVSDGKIEGLPSFAPQLLRERIYEGVAERVGREKSSGKSNASGELDLAVCPTYDNIRFDSKDLIIGGDEHRKLLEAILNNASSWVVIHSTFINAEKFHKLLPLFSDAASRGVRIDILWGKSKDDDGSNVTGDEVKKCRAFLSDETVAERIRLHSFTTNSHAKLIFADNGKGEMLGVIGSCNWLSTSFESFDVSIELKDPRMAGEVAAKLSKMAMGSSGRWSELVGDLASHAANLKRQDTTPTGGSQVRAAVVLGSEHNNFMQAARNAAKRRIVVASHKISRNADTLVVDPTVAAIEANHIDVQLYFSEFAKLVDEPVVDKIIKRCATEGIAVTQIISLNLHAKFLAWDDDSIVVTSQNWLSADPIENSCSEIGVYISAPGIATKLIDRARQVFDI